MKAFGLSRLEHLAWALLLLGLYTTGRVLGEASPLLMPPLGEILGALVAGIREGDLLVQTGFSLLLIAAALGAGTLGALFLVLLARPGSLRRKGFNAGRSLVETLTGLLHPLPGIALLPLIILWMGTGTPAVFFILIHSILWPLTTNLLAGFDQIPEIYRLVGQNYQLSWGKRFFRIELPAAFPFLLAGWRIGWARGWRALISAEMIFGAVGGTGGVGWFIFQKRVFMDTPGIFAGLTAVLLIGLLVEGLLFQKLERRSRLRWGTTG